MGKAKVMQPKKSDGCIVAVKSWRKDGAKASCLDEALMSIRAKKISIR